MKRAGLVAGALIVAIGLATASADIRQWTVNRLVGALDGIGGVRAYIEANRTRYLTPREARVDVRARVRADDSDDLLQLRNRLADFVWRDDDPRQFAAAAVRTLPDVAEDYDLPEAKRVREFEIAMEHGLTVNALYIEAAGEESDCLVVYHQDHNAIFLGERTWFRLFLAESCDVISVPLPLTVSGSEAPFEVRTGDRVVDLNDHNDFEQLATDRFTPIRYFVEPAVSMLNAALKEKSYDRIAAVGLSGGGWTSLLLAAIDKRITHAYPVAAALPLYLQTPGSRNRGDWEYHNPRLYAVANYFELYLLGVLEPRRRAVHIFNRADNCCFNGALTAGFSAQVEGVARRWGLGHIRFHVDGTGDRHVITGAALDLIRDDFLR